MEKSLFEGNGITSLGSADGEEDLKPKGGISINPPPDERCCNCCKRPLSELKSFGDDFNGALLLRTNRKNWPFIFEEAKKIYNAFYEDHGREVDRRLIENFGEDDAQFIILASGVCSCISSVDLCRDCIVLDNDDYFEKVLGLGETTLEMQARAKALYEKFNQMDFKGGSKRG